MCRASRPFAVVGIVVVVFALAVPAFAAPGVVPTDTTIEHRNTAAASTANQTALGSGPATLLLVLSALALAGVTVWLVSSRRPVRSTERDLIDP